MSQEVFCILGMHRSGTSCLAGSLQAAGLELGPYASTWDMHNRRGNRENPGFNLLHDRLLSDNGGSWDNPPATINWHGHHEALGRDLVSQYADFQRWGFKDPKILVAMDGWHRLIGPMRRIGIFRSPSAVAHSLQKRNGDDIGKWSRLWAHYNRLLLAEYDRAPFPILSFDWDTETFHQRLNALLPKLGLSMISKEQRFYTADLHHHGADEIQLSEDSRALYQRLLSISENEKAWT